MRNIKLILEYDGTDFVGWQTQPNGRSVQEELEKALKEITRDDLRVVGGGRTDSGVHARGQVANFRTVSEMEADAIVKGANAVLSPQIRVLHAVQVPIEFHARYSARGRRYRYFIARRPTALCRNYCWELGYKLDVDIMNRCATMILGEQEFASFCKAEADVSHHRCVVTSVGWTESDQMLEFEIVANRFLHGMVRALVGTMVDIGRGYRKPEEMQRIIDARDRREAGMAAPAKGLFLEEIYYEES